MTLRWFGSIMAAAALAMAAFAAIPDIPPAVAASKARPDNGATAGKAKPPIPLEVVGPIDTQARSALVMEVETGTVLLEQERRRTHSARVDVEADDGLSSSSTI